MNAVDKQNGSVGRPSQKDVSERIFGPGLHGIAGRLRWLMERDGMNKTRLWKALKLKNGTQIGHLVAGRYLSRGKRFRPIPDPTFLVLIAQLFDVDPGWFTYGTGKPPRGYKEPA